jgi:hypothetical protein
MGLEWVPGQDDGVLWHRLEVGDGPLSSGSFEKQSALSAEEPRTRATLHAAEMKGDSVYHVSRLEAACKSIAAVL